MTKAIREAARAVVERHYHRHTEGCYGTYRPCGEHHRHTAYCGSRPLYCRRPESDATINELRAALLDAQQKGLGG